MRVMLLRYGTVSRKSGSHGRGHPSESALFAIASKATLISYGLPSSLLLRTHRIRRGQNIVTVLSKEKANLEHNVTKLSEGKAINSRGQPIFI